MIAELAERPSELRPKTGSWVSIKHGRSSASTTKETEPRSFRGSSVVTEPTTTAVQSLSDLNASSPSYNDDQYKSFLSERSRLIQKKLFGELDRKEILELRMIEWAIDRAELSAHEVGLSNLEQVAEMQEKLLSQIEELNKLR